MANDDETAPIEDEALERIRADAVKRQASVEDNATAPGARRRPRKRVTPSPTTTAAEQAPPISPPALPAESVESPASAAFTQFVDDALPSAGADISAADAEHIEASNGERPDAEPGYWQPGSRLSTRVNPNPAPAARKSSDRGLIVAAVILVVALLVAIGLYLVANAVVSDDGPMPDTQQETEQSE